MLDLEKVMKRLSKKRPIFHSEADFQHALAWEIHELCPDCSIRLEYKPSNWENRIYIDVWVSNTHTKMAIELKYKTRKLTKKIREEIFDLSDQSAQDIGRYDLLKDIKRLEQIVKENKIIGYSIFLTNDSSYWKLSRSIKTVDADFRIHESRLLYGKLEWGSAASKGTTQRREDPIYLQGKYLLNWKEYSKPSKASYGIFRYLMLRVDYNNLFHE